MIDTLFRESGVHCRTVEDYLPEVITLIPLRIRYLLRYFAKELIYISSSSFLFIFFPCEMMEMSEIYDAKTFDGAEFRRR